MSLPCLIWCNSPRLDSGWNPRCHPSVLLYHLRLVCFALIAGAAAFGFSCSFQVALIFSVSRLSFDLFHAILAQGSLTLTLFALAASHTSSCNNSFVDRSTKQWGVVVKVAACSEAQYAILKFHQIYPWILSTLAVMSYKNFTHTASFSIDTPTANCACCLTNSCLLRSKSLGTFEFRKAYFQLGETNFGWFMDGHLFGLATKDSSGVFIAQIQTCELVCGVYGYCCWGRISLMDLSLNQDWVASLFL
jgi:hypothetical protein